MKNWENLRDDKCPMCGNEIKRRFNENYKCECGFYCRLSRAREILGDLDQKNFDKPVDDFLKKHNKFISVN